MLISLTLACRTQSLHLLDLRGMVKTKDSYVLLYSQVLKHSKPGKDNPVAVLKSYPPDRRLCVIFVLKEYLSRTEYILRDFKNAPFCILCLFHMINLRMFSLLFFILLQNGP